MRASSLLQSGQLAGCFAFGTYPATVRVTDGNHNEDSQTIRVLVGAKPLVTIQPGGAEGFTSVQMGHDLTLTAVASGFPAPAYQWYYLSEPIPGATAATLTIEDAGYEKVGNYGVRVSNIVGASTAKEVYVSCL